MILDYNSLWYIVLYPGIIVNPKTVHFTNRPIVWKCIELVQTVISKEIGKMFMFFLTVICEVC